jgi:type II secretory pathway pseudopilin PulG
MRSSSVKSLVNARSIAIATVLSLTLSVAVPTLQAATRSRGKSAAAQSETLTARVQRTLQQLINRLISITGELPSDPWPRLAPPATTNGDPSALPSDPLP